MILVLGVSLNRRLLIAIRFLLTRHAETLIHVRLLLHFVNHFLLGDELFEEGFDLLIPFTHAVKLHNDRSEYFLNLLDICFTVTAQPCYESIDFIFVHLF